MTGAQPGATAYQPDEEIDLRQLLARLWAGRVWIAVFAGAAALIGAAVAVNTEPTYRADALLQLEEKNASLALPTALTDLAGSDPRSVTEIEILKSRLVLGKAVAEAHLDWQAEPRRVPLIGTAVIQLGLPLPDLAGFSAFARGGEALRLDLLEVPPEWIGQPITVTATGPQSFDLRLPDDTTRSGAVGAPILDPALGFALRIGMLTAAPGREFILRQVEESDAITALRGRLAVTERGRQSNILELSFTGRDRDAARLALDAITAAYLGQNVARSAAEAESSLGFVESQLPAADAAVRTAETALNAYRQQQQAIDLGFEGQSLLTQVSALEDELQRIAAQEDELAARYTQNHPAYQQLIANRTRVEERLATLRREIDALPETQRQVFNLTRDLEVAQGVYLQLLNRSQELRVMKASTIGNVRVIDSARTGALAIAPRKSVILVLAVLLGAMAGVAFVLGRHAFLKGVTSAEEIDALGLPVFGTINISPQALANRKVHGKLPILALTHPQDLVVEGFRSLRTSLHFAMLDAKTRTIALTSAAPAAGKSFVSVNLGSVTAELGQKVCVVDADLRRGYLRRYFNVPRTHKGLADYLAGEATLDEVLIAGPVPGLFFVPTGAFPPNPSALLMRDSFGEFVRELNERFDLTIIDTPPALAVTDPAIIGRLAGATIVVARFGETAIAEIQAMQRQMENAGFKFAGAVLNGYDPRVARTRYGYGYGYSYRYDYKRRDEA